MTTKPTEATPYVFMSYASADRERALRLATVLEARGIAVWLDQKKIVGGSLWSAEIVEAIKGCTALVAFMSSQAVASANVQQELQIAWEYNRSTLPLRLDVTPLPPSMEYVLAGRQWVEVLDRRDTDWLSQALQALAGLGIVAQPAAVTAVEPPAESAETRPLADQVVAARQRYHLPAALTSFVGRE